MFLDGHSQSLSQGMGPQHPKYLGSPTYAHTVLHTATSFCIAIKLDRRKIITGSTMPKIFVTQMLMHDQFVVAGLLLCLLSYIHLCPQWRVKSRCILTWCYPALPSGLRGGCCPASARRSASEWQDQRLSLLLIKCHTVHTLGYIVVHSKCSQL